MKIIEKSKLDLNVWKITFINIRITFSPKQYRKSVKNYFQQNLDLTNWNLKTLVHIVPFVFGFSNMIWSRYQDQSIPYIFGISIPGTQNLKERISWETFKVITSKNINVKNIKQIDVYNDSCILQFNNAEQEFFVGIILPILDKNYSKIGFNIYKIGVEDYQNNFLGKSNPINFSFYYNLDEIPLKLAEIPKNQFNQDETSIFNVKLKNFLEIDKTLKNKKKIFKNNFNNPVQIPKKFLLNKNTNFSFSKNNGVIVKNIQNSNKNLQNLTENKTNNFLQKKEILAQEFESLFYKQGIIPLSSVSGKKAFKNKDELSKITNLKEFYFIDYCSRETFELLNDNLQLKNKNLNLSRKLSGYQYPDLKREDVTIFSLNFLFKPTKTKSVLKIAFPYTSLMTIKDNSLVSSPSCGPLIIKDRKDSFLGSNLDQDWVFKISKKNQLDWRNSITQDIVKKENKNFEDFDDSDPDSWFLAFKIKEKSTSFEEEYFFNFLKKIIKPENLDQINSSTQNFQNTKLIYHFVPISESFINQKIPNTIQVGDFYKRIPTFSTLLNENISVLQKNKFNFYESWEPISSTSWLIITQFSIGLFLLQLLKDLYKDYGKELVEYVLQFASSSGIDVEEIKEQYLYDDPGYRLIRKIKKRFKDIAGIDNILPQLGEIVWFLRNSGRSSKLKNSLPNGILLTGPPGTGKTLLVQAIAGEAQVPIIVESGSLLSDPQQKGRGVERLKKIFNQARQIAPCIIFIDEVDTLGEKRQNIIQTAMGNDELIESIYENNSIEKVDETSKNFEVFLPKPLNLNEDITIEKDLEYQLFRGDSETQVNIGNEKFQKTIEAKKTRLSLLTQFLVEMDGLKERQGVIVIGATNRPNVLDPALIRPGRFDKILNLELPGNQKRIEILKLYGKNIKIEKNISWEYLAKRTKGFSAADLAAAMNESTIKSILGKTTHTIETIEHGIDLVTSYNFDTNLLTTQKQSKDPFFLSRLAYYQAGKAVLPFMVENHPPLVVLHLWPRQKNARHSRLYQNFSRETTDRLTLEAELVGLYAGKASEMIALYGNKISNSLKRWHSDLGLDDLLSATFLANLLVDKWYFYSNQILIRKTNQILNNRNEKVFNDVEKLELSKIIDNEIEDELEVEKIAKLSRTGRYQQRGFGPWWQIQVAKQTSEIESFFADWYRIYLPDPEETILNLEWIPPDEYYHSNNSLKKLSEKSDTSYNDLYKIERDYIFHGLTLNAFNKAFSSLETKREFLDYFADYLLRFQILRQNTIQVIVKENNINQKTLKQNQLKNYKILENFWGINSRRKKYRFLNSEIFEFIKENSNYESPFFMFNKSKKN